ncbi:ABC transporter, substrate-binding protein, aliphatic sulfonates family [compost metagenome]
MRELRGQTISVPFASTAHGMLLRAIAAQGWNPDTDVSIIAQPPEVAGSALQANKIAAHADFVPFAELFESRGFARKIYDGSQANAPTFHGALVESDFAKKYPEVVVAYLRASLEANQLLAAEPEKYSELIEKVTGVEASVNYLFHGPLGLQTRDLTWKPEYRQAVATSIETLKLLKKADRGLNTDTFINDSYLRQAFKANGLDYEQQLRQYAAQPLQANDALTGQPITDFKHVAQIWVKGEPKVRSYATPQAALAQLASLQQQGKEIRAVYAQASDSGIKLLANQAWFVRDGSGQLSAFLLKEQAQHHAQANGGSVLDYAGASQQALAKR